MTQPYDAFISYRRADAQSAAHWIRRELQNFRPPKRLRDRCSARLRVYLDAAYEQATNDFFEANIKPAVLASRHLVVLASPAAVTRADKTNDWIWREIDVFQNGPNAGRILVVRVAGEFDGPLPADLAKRFPNMEIIDLRDTSRFWFLSPTRAVRINGEKLKLLGPLLGVSPEDMPILRQEEEKRQQARLGLVVGAAAAIILSVGALSIFAMESRYRATQALDDSIFATGRMINSIAMELDRGAQEGPRSSLLNQACDLLDKLGSEAAHQPSAEALATCETERGLALEAQEETDKARVAFEAAVDVAERRYGEEPQQMAAFAIVDARQALAEFERRQKNEDDFRGMMDALAERAEALFAKHLSAVGLLERAADAEETLAIAYQGEGEVEKALAAAEQEVRLLGLAVDNQLEPEPRLVERRAGVLRWVAARRTERNEDALAAEAYRQSVALWEPLLAQGKASIDGRFHAAAALMDFAAFHLKNHHANEARPLVDKAKAVIAALGADPSKLSDKGKVLLADMRRSLSDLESETLAVPVSAP